MVTKENTQNDRSSASKPSVLHNQAAHSRFCAIDKANPTQPLRPVLLWLCMVKVGMAATKGCLLLPCRQHIPPHRELPCPLQAHSSSTAMTNAASSTQELALDPVGRACEHLVVAIAEAHRCNRDKSARGRSQQRTAKPVLYRTFMPTHRCLSHGKLNASRETRSNRFAAHATTIPQVLGTTLANVATTVVTR